MTLLFLSRDYFKSWNCLREVRHAMIVHMHAQDGFVSMQGQAVADRRGARGVHMRSSIVLVRETDEVFHGGQPIDELLQACPEQIGCEGHVKAYDGACAGCHGFPVDVRAALTKHAASAGPGLGVIEWWRTKAFKVVSLKQIVQSMLLAKHGQGGADKLPKALGPASQLKAECGVYVSGEIDTLPCHMPRGAAPRVLLHSECHLTEDLRRLLAGAVGGLDLQVVDGDSSVDVEVASAGEADAESDVGRILRAAAVAAHPVILLVVVHRGCFKQVRVVRSLLLALQTKTQIVLVHESDVKNNGCTFSDVIGSCPPAVMGLRGYNGQKVFEPIAVQWTRGAHQPVSVRILAQALGAKLASTAGTCAGLAASLHAAPMALKGLLGARSQSQGEQPAEERVRGWSTFDDAGGGPDNGDQNPAVPGSTNPMVRVNPVGGQSLDFRGNKGCVPAPAPPLKNQHQ
jgi:hypothetical protein